MPYRVEDSPNKRATCRDTYCKSNAVKIQKGELRFATWVEIQDHAGWQYRHWGCVTPKVIHNFIEATEHDTRLIDGLDELCEESKAKVLRAYEQGKVADEDWRHDVELNIIGGSKKRAPTRKKKQADDNVADAENVGKGDDGAPSPSKSTTKKAKAQTKSKKNSRAKATDDEVDDDHEQVPELTPDSEEVVKPAKKKARGRPKKEAIKEEEDDDAVEMPDENSTESPVVDAKARKSKKRKADDTTGGVAKRTSRRTKQEPDVNVKDEPEDDNDEPPTPEPIEQPKKRGRKKKTVLPPASPDDLE